MMKADEHREILYGSDDWYMVCATCGRTLRNGDEALVIDDELGNGTTARCSEHDGKGDDDGQPE